MAGRSVACHSANVCYARSSGLGGAKMMSCRSPGFSFMFERNTCNVAVNSLYTWEMSFNNLELRFSVTSMRWRDSSSSRRNSSI